MRNHKCIYDIVQCEVTLPLGNDTSQKEVIIDAEIFNFLLETGRNSGFPEDMADKSKHYVLSECNCSPTFAYFYTSFLSLTELLNFGWQECRKRQLFGAELQVIVSDLFLTARKQKMSTDVYRFIFIIDLQ